MTQTANSTMAPSRAADPSFTEVIYLQKSKQLKAMLVQKDAVKWAYSFMICVYFVPPCTFTKFNSVLSMHTFFIEMLKYEP